MAVVARLILLACVVGITYADHGEGGSIRASLLKHSFEERADLPEPRSDFTATTAEDYIYLIGGCVGSTQVGYACPLVSDQVIQYSPLTDKYANLSATLETARYRHSAVKRGEEIFIFGGRALDDSVVTTVEVLNVITHELRTLDGVEVPFSDGAAFSRGDDLYFCGGYSSSYNISSACLILDATNALTAGPSMNIPRGDFHAVSIPHEGIFEVFAFGGFTSNNGEFEAIGSLEMLGEDGAETWSLHEAEDNGLARGDKALEVMDGRIYVFGGEVPNPTGQDGAFPMSDVHMFSPEVESVTGKTGEWSMVSEMPLPKFRFPAAEHGDSVYLFGGQGRPTYPGADPVYEILASVHRYAEAVDEIPITLHGSGTTNPSRFFWKWMSIFESRSKVPLHMTYRAVGSSSGMSDFKEYPPVVDFACGDIPLTSELYNQLNADGHEVIHVPFALGTISIFANIPGLGSTSLKLRPCTLAKIYKLEITKWGDAAILEDNPDLRGTVTSEADIVPLKRTRGSSSTFGITQYMHETCPEVWDEEPGATFVAAGPAVIEVQGSSQMTSNIRDTDYAIGYLDSGHGISNGLAEVALQLADSTQFATSSDPVVDTAAASVGVDFPDATADWSEFSLQGKPSPAWPITMVSYFYLHKDMRGSGAKASLLKAFLQFVLDLEEQSESQDDLEESFGFTRLSPELLELSRGAIEQLDLPADAPVFTFETDTLVDGEGMGDYVISAKRNPDPFDEEAQTAATAALQTTTTELEAALKELLTKNDEADNAWSLAVAALVVSLISILCTIVLLVAFFCFGRASPSCAKETEMRDQASEKQGAPKDFSDNISRA